MSKLSIATLAQIKQQHEDDMKIVRKTAQDPKRITASSRIQLLTAMVKK